MVEREERKGGSIKYIKIREKAEWWQVREAINRHLSFLPSMSQEKALGNFSENSAYDAKCFALGSSRY